MSTLVLATYLSVVEKLLVSNIWFGIITMFVQPGSTGAASVGRLNVMVPE